MTRINVYTYDDEYGAEDEQRFLVGWFREDSATEYTEDTDLKQNSVNHVPKHCHQGLFRTAQGRWVLRTWSEVGGTEPRHEFVDDAGAKEWLLRNDHDQAVEQWFGELEAESGPRLGGRPSIGQKWEVRLDEETQRRVSEYGAGRPRADVLRELIAAGLTARDA
ncbi:hypothetical protein ACODT4_44295 [Streptomyces sp. 2.9]|uniref:hypothetical protein n=1 Tax=Streptomyces tritrimontium TaxID=3406573 RepID=UPI003BB791EF